MISFIFGENTFENERTLQKIIAEFSGGPERVDGETLEIKHIPDLFMAATLFAEKRLVIIKNLSENKALWNVLGEWLERLSDDVHLVLVETKPDKRSKTYKQLQKMATVYESKLWGERDVLKMEQWIVKEAEQLGFSLDKKSAQTLVRRVGVDQWLLHQALQKLLLADEITQETIEALTDANPAENVFNLFEAALKRDAAKVHQMVEVLQTNEDPYRVFGLLSTQAFQLAALSASEKSAKEVVADLGTHPFVLSKMAPFANSLGKKGVKAVIAALDEADASMKTSTAEPWLLIERALLKAVPH